MNNLEAVAVKGHFEVGHDQPFLLIAGPCVLESETLAREVAGELKEIAARLGISLLFKASFDKANRTSLASFRGPGLGKGLAMLGRIGADFGLPLISDIHEPAQAGPAAAVLDVLQIPAFLCRQTDLLLAAAETGRPLAIKKAQFLSPWDMRHVVDKVAGAGRSRPLLIERGTMLGYNNLVVDMRAFAVMRSLGCPVVFDATHSVQLPGGGGTSSGGQREFIPSLARAAVAAGIDGLFIEVHPDPDRALCDGPNSLRLDQVEPMLRQLLQIHALVGQSLER